MEDRVISFKIRDEENNIIDAQVGALAENIIITEAQEGELELTLLGFLLSDNKFIASNDEIDALFEKKE